MLTNSLTFFPQHIQWKRKTQLEVGVGIVGTLSWMDTLRTWRTRCLCCWISASPTTVLEVALTLLLMDTYITLMIYIDHSMRQSLTKSESIDLTTIITHLRLSHLCLLLQVRLGVAGSGVQLVQTDRGQFHFLLADLNEWILITTCKNLVWSTLIGRIMSIWILLFTTQGKVGLTLTKDTVLRITLNLDGAPITSKSHSHPSHSQTSRLLTSSLSIGVPVPRSTQCMWVV